MTGEAITFVKVVGQTAAFLDTAGVCVSRQECTLKRSNDHPNEKLTDLHWY